LQRPDDNEVVFKKDDRVLMLEEAATELVNEGVAELRDRYFLRPLNDYRYVLRRLRLRLDELASRQTELQFEKQVLEQAISKTEGMLVENQSIKLKLEQDLTQFRVEKTAIDDYTVKMREQLDQMRTEMAQLHQHNLLLEQEIAQKHQSIQRRLDGISMAK
jgi:chromosome segregation ATPase